MIKLGILDQSPIRTDGSHADAIAETLKLAQSADRLGYSRYWVAEHHNSFGLACTAPEILITRIASLTQHLRVGAGGIMLSHYSPLKVAETFRMLETLFPGRIDMGIGRAPGTDRITANVLRSGSDSWGTDQFPTQVADLLGFVSGRSDAQRPHGTVHALPASPSIPPTWLLGSSDQSAGLAAHFGCGFSFAHFINREGGPTAMRAYRDYFQPSPEKSHPEGILAVFVLCAPSDEEADRLCTSRDLWRLRVDQGRMGPFPSVAEATAYPYTQAERARIALNQQRQVVGCPERVKDRLLELSAAYGVEELLILSICFDFESRLRSYHLLAEAFDLPGPA